MRSSLRLILALAMIAAVLPLGLAPAGAAITDVSISEIRIDQSSTDNDEFFELAGPSGQSLDGLSYLVIGDGSGGSGVIESVTGLTGTSIPGSGFFVAAESTFTLGTADLTVPPFPNNLNFENSDNVTHMLVSGFLGSKGDDLDTDDDGSFDTTPWTAVVDSVALVETPASGDKFYSATTVGPDGTFVPAHVYKCFVWFIGSFGFGDETVGAANSNCPAPPVAKFIHEVQGAGSATPIPGTAVIIEGVVVGDFQGNAFAGSQLDGFFVQEEKNDQDADPATSEGVFVFAPGAVDVTDGDVVEVVGTAGEFSGMTQIGNVSSVTITGTGSVKATAVSLPVSDQSDWEPVEGMLVKFKQELYIAEYFNFDRFGEIVLTSDRQFQPTQVEKPGSTKAAAVATANSLDRITLDDGRTSGNPDPAIHPDGAEFTLTNTFRGGDTLRDVTGVVNFAFGSYRIQPTQGAKYKEKNRRPTDPGKVKGDLRVASFNVLNFFTTIDSGPDVCGPTGLSDCRGADSVTEYNRQLAKLLAGIIALDADIVGFQEVENDIRDDDGSRSHNPILTIVEELNVIEGAGTWAWIGELDHYNDYPIRNEIIYRASAVTPVGDPETIADLAFDDFRPGDFEPLGRPPVAQRFMLEDDDKRTFTLVVNHFKSKGSSCFSIGDPDIGDGQANCNLTRVAQAEVLMAFVADLQATSGDDDVLIIGDLNSYAKEDPVEVIKLGPDGAKGGGDEFTDLVKKYEKKSAYTFVFDGQLGTLDHALASKSMKSQVKDLTVFHINTDEPDILDYDTSFKKDAQDALYEALPYRASDHDPVIIGLDLKKDKKDKKPKKGK